MHWIDYLVLIFVLLSLLVTGFLLARIAGKNTAEFYVAGRKMPWWLVGMSDVAVGLNTSSMLQDSRKVRQDGVMGLMTIWAFALKTVVAAVFFDRLWRRARFKTQMEFYEARYTGWQAKFARIYDSVVFGGLVTSIWAAVGLVGMKKVAITVMGLPPALHLLGLTLPIDSVVVVAVILIALTYSAAAGARGVYWTDLIELLIALVALYSLLAILYTHIGGSTGLREHIEAMGGAKTKYLTFLQPFSLVYIGMFVINPLLDNGGFNPGMQRTLSLKDEREVLYMLIFKGVLGFVVRGMPFIAIGLIGMFMVNDQFLLTHFAPLHTPGGAPLPDWERVLPVLVNRYLPVGLTGLMTAAFVCAFMSSFDSNIHLTGSVLVNDVYRPFLVKDKGEHHYVAATKIVMTIASLATILIGIFAKDILYLGFIALTISLGAGWIKLLRLIWWRANGAADVASQIAALFIFGIILSPLGTKLIVWTITALGITSSQGFVTNDSFIIVRNVTAAALSTTVGLIAMAVTRPEPMEKLCSFYKRMRPFGFWGPVRRELGTQVKAPDPIGVQVALTLSCLAVIWGAFFAALSGLLAFWVTMAEALALLAVGTIGCHRFILRLYPKDQAIEEYRDEEEEAALAAQAAADRQ